MDGDEYLLDTETVRGFISDVRAAIAEAPSPQAACDAIRPRLAERLLFRAGDRLSLTEQRGLEPGDFRALIPPTDDIHRTTSPATSVSIHLLTNDTGCPWRHAYDPESGDSRPFRSGYVNVACEE